MRLFRTLPVCALLLAIPTPAWSGKEEKKHVVHGLVLELKRDADNDNGSFTMRVVHKKPKAQVNEPRSFQVTAETRFVKIHEGRKEKAPSRTSTRAST
jgi:hypothetical protein